MVRSEPMQNIGPIALAAVAGLVLALARAA
jgi:hypothetical protein